MSRLLKRLSYSLTLKKLAIKESLFGLPVRATPRDLAILLLTIVYSRDDIDELLPGDGPDRPFGEVFCLNASIAYASIGIALYGQHRAVEELLDAARRLTMEMWADAGTTEIEAAERLHLMIESIGSYVQHMEEDKPPGWAWHVARHFVHSCTGEVSTDIRWLSRIAQHAQVLMALITKVMKQYSIVCASPH